MSDLNRPVVVFDIGGVLIHVWSTWQEASLSAGVKAALPADPPVFLEDLPAFVAYQAGQMDESSYFKALGEQLGVSEPDALRAHDGILGPEFPGVRAIIAKLRSSGIRTGILSNTNAPHWEVLLDPARYPAIGEVEMPMASHLAGVAKPDLHIYRIYASRFELNGAPVVYFDDNARNVAAGLSFGWRAHQIDPHNDPAAQIRAALVDEGLL